jgi:BirA family biotin operon repressor/biotin-[acetyl-CoA-carboxylase] ligase
MIASEPVPRTLPAGTVSADAVPAAAAREEPISGWTALWHGTVASTQDIAASLSPWNAVLAEIQTAGRGQWRRTFTSDRGGLYLTAVLPFDGNAVLWRGFALWVGRSIVSAFHKHDIAALRLRWPNDLMIGDRKAGGILVSQGRPDTLCVGLGLNVTNRPWLRDPGLGDGACRLADFAPTAKLEPGYLARTLLDAIRLAHAGFSRRGLAGFADDLNRSWGPPRAVRLELAEGGPAPEVSGRFLGILANGDLLLEDPAGKAFPVRAHLVKRLYEI